MKLDSEFYRLPLTFDIKRLKHEVSLFNESEWMPHPTGYQGNSSIPLISVNGEYNDDFSGPMSETPALKKCPYISQVISSFGEVFGRSRLMRLGPGYQVPEHSDINYHWHSRVRIHIPITTYPEVIFYCGDKNVHMAAGETWIFDSWKMHKVENGSDKKRVHLVIDTAGSSRFWDLVKRSEEPHNKIFNLDIKPSFLEFNKKAKSKIQTEKVNTPLVMSSGELDALCMGLIQDASRNDKNSQTELIKYSDCINEFRHNWRSNWALYGQSEQGWPNYQALISKAMRDLAYIKQPIELFSNHTDGQQVFNALVLSSCLNPPRQKPVQIEAKKPEKEQKPGRNSPCPCGSGKKYKRCHGANS